MQCNEPVNHNSFELKAKKYEEKKLAGREKWYCWCLDTDFGYL